VNTAPGDSTAKNGTYKMCVILVKKGEDTENRDNWLYLPASKVDATGHMWYGGVTQTNVQLVSEKEVTIFRHGSVSITGEVGPDIRKVNNAMKTASGNAQQMGDWAGNIIETYDLGIDARNKLIRDYNIVGILVWGSSL